MKIRTNKITLIKPMVSCPVGTVFERTSTFPSLFSTVKGDPAFCDLQLYTFTEDQILSNKEFFDFNEKKCYVSGKITGLPPSEFIELFDNAMLEVNKLGFYAVSPLSLKHDHDESWLSYMRVDLKALCDCDAIYMIGNWKDSKGAKIEHDLALLLGLEIIYA